MMHINKANDLSHDRYWVSNKSLLVSDYTSSFVGASAFQSHRWY